MSSVYAIRSDTGLMKIGMTMGEPENRMSSLQTGNPHVLTMFASFQVSDYGIDAAAFEAAMHRRLAPFRTVGEWFRVPDWMVIKVFQVTAAEFHQPKVYARWERRFGRYCRMWTRKILSDYAKITTLHIRDVAAESMKLEPSAPVTSIPLTVRGTQRQRAPKGTFDRKAYQAQKARRRRAALKAAKDKP